MSQRPAKIPMVLIRFAFRCLSVVPVCVYSHSAAMLRTAAFLMGITLEELEAWSLIWALSAVRWERKAKEDAGDYSVNILRAAAP